MEIIVFSKNFYSNVRLKLFSLYTNENRVIQYPSSKFYHDLSKLLNKRIE